MLLRHAIALSAAACFLGCASQTKTTPSARPSKAYTEPKTEISLPSDLCGMARNDLIKDDASVALVYSQADSNFSASITFDGSATYLMTGAGDEATKASFEKILNTMREMETMSRYVNVSVKRQETIPVDVKGNSDEALFAECTYTDGDTDKGAYVLATAYSNQIVKIRFSFPVVRHGSADQVWGCLLKALN